MLPTITYSALLLTVIFHLSGQRSVAAASNIGPILFAYPRPTAHRSHEITLRMWKIRASYKLQHIIIKSIPPELVLYRVYFDVAKNYLYTQHLHLLKQCNRVNQNENSYRDSLQCHHTLRHPFQSCHIQYQT